MAAFDAGALCRSYAFLDDCPEALLPALLALPVGDLAQRVTGVLRWRAALLAGSLPAEDQWPPPEVSRPVREALTSLDLARFCRDQPELVDALLPEILAAFTRQSAFFEGEVARRLAELEELERLRVEEEKRHHRLPRPRPPSELLESRTRRELADRAFDADSEVLRAWAERCRVWSQLEQVFGDLGQMLGRGYDLSLGVLRHTGWLDLLRLRKLLETQQTLKELIRALGRLHHTEAGPSVAETILEPVRRLEEERRQVPTPLVPAETRGVERSGEIHRMLPAEAVLLGHPRLRLLWHARRAERALLCYRVEGTEEERVQVEREAQEEVQRQRPRPHRGPIVAVIDTSGSMNGLPEQVAKAIVLEAARTAHQERRRCYLYAYSGPGQVLEQELDLGPQGIGRLLSFLSASFGGGTDIGALSAVVRRLGQEDWKKADVVLVSDGEWGAPVEILRAVASAKEAGTRFHGVQVGNRGRTGIHTICEPVHEFDTWARAGGW